GAWLGLRNGVEPPEGVVQTVDRYGDARQQDAQWWAPPRAGRLPTVVLVHGGFWRPGFDRGLEEEVAADLSGRGYLVLNVDYRSSDAPWPTTLTDAAAAYDLLATGTHADRVDPARVAVVGHSAGGHLALWLASRHTLPAGAAGAAPRGPRPALAVGQAPVAALVAGAQQQLGGGAVQALLGGGPDEVPDRYAVADPVARLPTGVRTACLHGEDDDIVPLRQSELYVEAATAAGDDARLVVLPGGHFEHLAPASPAGRALVEALEGL
ncbi:MAG TPA: alpha/beta hydrolase, partial [Mycobacteriales bacterium]|nr:alpha/beta hydrolase [Mycobacteriales bacterium]